MVEATHGATRTWYFSQDGNFTVSFDFMNQAFNDLAIKEGIIQSKEKIRISTMEVDNKERQVVIKSEIFKLLEN